MATKMKNTDWVAISLILIGGLNWGLIGAFDYNLVEAIFADFSKVVYSLVGLASIYSIYSLTKIGKRK